MVTTAMKLVNLNTDAARDVKVSFLAAAVAGDTSALLVYADWLEETGHGETATKWRREVARYEAYDRDTKPPRCGGTWIQWACWYELSRMAQSLVRGCTSFTRLMYCGNYNPDGSFMRDDGSIEYAVKVSGYVPTLRRGNVRQAKLGRLVEAAGFEVFWIE